MLAPVTSISPSPTPCPAVAVSQRLRALRRGSGLTQSGRALRLGATQFAVARLHCGRQRLSLTASQRIVTELGGDVTVVISEQQREI